jgi:hypothetical protein
LPSYRLTGASTAKALLLISSCISDPNQWFKVVDHYGTKEADYNLMMMIDGLVRRMGLLFFNYKRTSEGCFVTCNLMEAANA